MGSELVDKLKAEGWVERFTASGARLEEAIETYRELGLLYWDGDQFLEAQEAFQRYLAESPEATDRFAAVR